MEARPANHPLPNVLRALVAGQLDDATAEQVFAHLEHCSECRQAAATLSGDGFLRRLRAGRAPASTTSEAQALGDTRGSRAAPARPATPDAVPDVPAELRNHPDYEITRELGRGGMGVVCLARNKLTDRQEALKVVNQRFFDQPGMKERFLREIRSAARLDHPHIVRAHTAVQLGDLLVLAMEYVEGEDLAAAVRARGPLPVVNACYYTQQAALGL
jgi:hypothetical protein